MPGLSLQFAPQHASTQGHFAGNPIIPGALLLAEVLRALQTALPEAGLSYALKAAKFTHPLRPGEVMTLDYERTAQEIKFLCRTADNAVLSGTFKCQPAANPI